MRHSAIIAVIIATAALFFAIEVNAASFSVKVQNGSKQETLPNYPISLSVGETDAKGDYVPKKTIELRTDENGLATGHIDPSGASLGRAEVVYRGVTYRSEIFEIGPEKKTYSFGVPVYEITNDNSAVSVESRRMIVLTKNDKTLEIYETLVVNNSGNMAYVGRFNDELDLNQVLFIPMPAGYMLYGFSGYEDPKIRPLGSGIPTQNEVLPGTKELNMHYYVQSDTGEFDLNLLSQKGAPEIETFTLFFPKENSWRLKQSGLRKAGEEFVNEIPYTVLKGNHGSIVRMKAFGPTYEGGFGLWHISIILAFLLAGLTLFLARENIRARMLQNEEQRLEVLLDELEQEIQESNDGDLSESYASFKQTLQGRLGIIKSYFEQA